MIKVSYSGGLGNNLWQYTAGRILAEKLGAAFDAPPITDIPNLETKIHGKRYWLRRKSIQGHFIPDDCRGKLVQIKSGLERYENIVGRQKDIKQWIDIPKKSLYQITRQDLVLSVRRGWNNYPVEENCPSFDYYNTLLANFKFSKLFICTDSPDDKFFEDFKDNFKNLLVPQQVLKFESGIKEILSRNKSCCITVDHWTNRQNRSYLGIIGRLLYESLHMKSFLLGCNRFK